MCLEHLEGEASRRRPDQMPEPPQLAPFDTEDLYEINPKELGNLPCQVKGNVALLVLDKTAGTKWYPAHLDKGGTPVTSSVQ